MFRKDQFEWDENKRLINLEKHRIDFRGAIRIFEQPSVHVPSGYWGEERWITIGELNGWMIMVVWTWRGSRKRIISARRLKEDEQRRYQDNDSGGSSP
ncbi:MAG: BrnT family toxin [Rhodobacteraceae bacterium]|nr:BrnT family toxin [Paracoccaceae bacterium]